MNLSRLVFLFLSFPGPLLLSQPRIWSSAPYEQAVDSTSVTIVWQTLLPRDTRLRYGLTDSLELGEIFDTTMTTQHLVSMTGLRPSTIYQVQFSSSNSGGTSTGPLYTVSTASPSSSTGAINVYFNKSVETSIATGQSALANQRLDLGLSDRISAARYSIDCALFNLSGGIGASIANALIAAQNRGVKVRVVMETDRLDRAPPRNLVSNGITIVSDTAGKNGGSGLHHNKFFVFDYRDIRDSSIASAADDWVWTGSWNPTDPGTSENSQDAIEIQDQALAGAFTREFEEMWGSSTDTPDPSNSRFSARKMDNTPHVFTIGGRTVWLFFSPSDGTSTQINLTLRSADHSIAFALLLFTDDGLAQATVSSIGTVKVRGVIENATASGSDYDFLISNGVDLLIDPNDGLLHHKYAIVDGEFADSTPWVIVGSHNWTAAANTKNDENTLLIQDAQIANLFLQEFAARYYEAGGQDSIVVPPRPLGGSIPTAFKLYQNFPNPFNPTTKITFELPRRSVVSLTVFNVLGEEVATLVNEELTAGRYLTQWNASGIASGVYFYRLVAKAIPSGQAGGFVQSKKLMLMR